MFSRAYAIASQYTRPLLLSKRLEDRTVGSGFATFMLLNKDGWALTAAHVMKEAVSAQQHAKERDDYKQAVLAIEGNSQVSPGKKRHELNKLVKNWKWITNISFWWAQDGVAGDSVTINEALDLAIVKLQNYETLQIATFPSFAAQGLEISPGTSLCRLGFPFHSVNAQFDSATQRFQVNDMPPLSMFPNEGIHTRIMLEVNTQTGTQTKFIETSSPGLRGQSGGPIFDAEGRVWAIQSKTLSIPLGFAPTIKDQHREIVEHQFIHIGVGCHVEHVRDFLRQNNVEFQTK